MIVNLIIIIIILDFLDFFILRILLRNKIYRVKFRWFRKLYFFFYYVCYYNVSMFGEFVLVFFFELWKDSENFYVFKFVIEIRLFILFILKNRFLKN